MLLRSPDRWPGTLSRVFPGPPLVLNFASIVRSTLSICALPVTMGVVLPSCQCQVLGTPAEQERHAYAVPFFP